MSPPFMRPAPSPSLQLNDRRASFGSHENRRCAIRYAIRADVVVNWVAKNGMAQQSRGYTRDVSPGGAYIFAREFPAAGHAVQITILLPTFGGESREPRVTVNGHVLRIDKPPLAGESGFSVCSQRVSVCAV